MRVLVCGGRNYADRDTVGRLLGECHAKAKPGCLRIVQGGATGADALARDWCFQNFVTYENFAADWKRHGKAAGPIRNARMLAEGKPDVVIAFPGGRGTADMVRLAEAAGVPIVYPAEQGFISLPSPLANSGETR